MLALGLLLFLYSVFSHRYSGMGRQSASLTEYGEERKAVPVTISANFNTGANFGFDVRWRRATGARRKSHQAGAIEKALMPTYANGAIGACPT